MKDVRAIFSLAFGVRLRQERRTDESRGLAKRVNIIRALIIRIGFWGPLYYTYKKEPRNSVGNY